MLTYKQILTVLGALVTFSIVNGVELETELNLHEETNRLAFLNADPNTVTISGASAGGAYSCHMQIVYSETIKGAGCS